MDQTTNIKILEKLNLLIKQTESNDVLWAAGIGAGAAIIPQLIILVYTHFHSKKQQKLEIKAEIHRLIHLLKDHYRELAMHKAHKNYWYAHYQNSKLEGDKEEAEKFYSSHMASSSYVRETELKISGTFSEFYKMIIKFQHLTKFDKRIKKQIDNYDNYTPSKVAKIDSKSEDLVAEERKVEDQLISSYSKYFEYLDNIIGIIEAKR